MQKQVDKFKTNKLILTALLTAMALVSFVIESSLPPLTPIYGVKLGIANVFTLFALYAVGTKEAAAVLFIRVLLGNIFTGQMMSFAYSLVGGILSFLMMLVLKKFISINQLWVISAISAVFHNIGQITVALIITGTFQIIYYLPVLIISGIISGILTGICAQLVLIKLDKLGFIEINRKHLKDLK